MNGVEKSDVDMPSTPESQYPAYLFKNGVKPNFTPQAFEKLQSKGLGFTRSLVDRVYLETVVFFYDFHGLGGIRSTQPTGTDG